MLPGQTAEIFKELSKGQFISANSHDKTIRTLYRLLDDEENFMALTEYFSQIEFTLEKGHDYFYFSRPESKVTLESKLERAYRWIDILDFFKTYNHAFGAGYRFRSAEILVKIKTDADLEAKLEGLRKYTREQTKHEDILANINRSLVSETFFELENEITGQYKVLSAFHYLEALVLTINIPEDISHEISE